MKKKILIVIFIMLLTSLIAVFPIETVEASGITLYVGGSGPGNYSSIQSAINAASSGDTVFVYSGAYLGEDIDINKVIDLIGEDRNSTIIDSQGPSPVVHIQVDGVNVSGFTIRGGLSDGLVFTNHCTISNNIIRNNDFGIFSHNPSYNNVSDNIFISNRWATHFYNTGGDNIVSGNTFTWNGEGSIYFYLNDNNIIHDNVVQDTGGVGIVLTVSDYNIITNNTLENSELGIRIIDSSSNNEIYHNNLINNIQNTIDTGTNTWDDGYPSGGNYWSDFDEPSEGAWDNNSDGIVDSPYDIPGGSNQDLYPFMEPDGWLQPPNQPPIANFTYTPTNPTNTDIIEFTDTSFDPDGTIMSWWWDFGDGYYSDLQNPIHCYYDEGAYAVTLTVTDDDGGSDTFTVSIVTTSPSEEVTNLIDDIEAMDLPHHGLENSLTQKLMNVIQSLGYGWVEDAINQLNAFINQVEAQRGNKLTEVQADYLVNAAQAIIGSL